MRTTQIALLAALSILAALGCAEIQYAPPTTDSGIEEPEGDAGRWAVDSHWLVDASPRVDTADSGVIGNDAGPIPDAGHDAGAPDAGDATPDAGAPDAGDADAGDATPDAGAPDAGDATPDAGAPDAGPPGCAPDGFEPNDSPEDAVVVRTGTGWADSTYPLTWSEGDEADWIRAELDSTDIVGLFRVHAADTDSRSMVEVRVTCFHGIAVCRGIGARQVGATCIAERMFNAYVDVACNTASPAPVDILVGSTRGRNECAHSLWVNLYPADV